eukprot:1988587-Rhodomonas_salina.3
MRPRSVRGDMPERAISEADVAQPERALTMQPRQRPSLVGIEGAGCKTPTRQRLHSEEEGRAKAEKEARLRAEEERKRKEGEECV